jgi:two-component system OmpR family sensor kinase
VPIALTALWLALAIALSAFTLHLTMNTIRSGDFDLTEAANGLGRMSEAMAERGASSSDISTAVVSAARTRGLDVTTQAIPPEHSLESRPENGPRRPEPIGFMAPPPGMFGLPDPSREPTMIVHAGNSMLFLSLPGDPVGRILRGYFAAMILLVLVALASTWYANDVILRRVLAPAQTIESALRRLAGGEYARLEMVGHEPAEAAIVDAYNAAADELASSVRMRGEAESNLRLFVADAGHELRTPLTVIMGFVDVLRQGAIAEQAVAQRILESVAAEGERMRLLISKLLLLARLDTVAPERHETIDLSRLAAEMVDSFRPLAGATKLQTAGQPGVAAIGAASEMRETIGILIDNALKYAPGSNVRISVEWSEGFAVLTVADDGPGMQPDLVARAFDRFSRGDDRGSIPGSGLGLAIVKRIATRAGGEVDLESSPGRGTRVSVRLPLAGD